MTYSLKTVTAICVGISAYLVYIYVFNYEYSPMVETIHGKVKGFLSISRLEKEYYSFLGIRYAQPPLGKLRFEPPEEPLAWSDTKEATNFGSKCLQIDIMTRTMLGSEDCLFINVYVPKIQIIPFLRPILQEPWLNKKALLPVIFYIHGGYFMTGWSNVMGPKYLLDEEIILVTINYRLNIFGFLNTADEVVVGNMGLKDQNLALKWTRDNIKNFGGDPDRITLAGQSAGSAAVHFHILSPMSRGLFSAAIMSSGTAIKPWSFVDNPKAQAEYVAKKLNCSTSSSREMSMCLKKVDAADLVKIQASALSSPLMNPLEIFAPSIENVVNKNNGVFLPAHPYDILLSGNISKVPILTGVNSEEGLLLSARMMQSESLMHSFENEWKDLSPKFLLYLESLTEVTEKIRQYYFDSVANLKRNFTKDFKNLTNLFSDRLYIHPTHVASKIHSRLSPVYLYYFEYPVKKGMIYLYDVNPNWPVVPQFVLKEINWFLNEHIFKQEPMSLGVMHGDDVSLVFDFPTINLSPGTKDFGTSRQMVKMWSDFAQNPLKMNFNGKIWPSISPSEKVLKYMLISKNKKLHGSLVDEPFYDRMTFWNKLNIPWKIIYQN